MSNCNKGIFMAMVGWTAGLVGVGYAISTHTKLTKISERLDKSIDELADSMEIDIPKEIIDKAVDKAITEETRRAATKAANDAVSEIKRDIRATVSAAVEKEYDSIKIEVLREITDAASKIDIDKVHKDVAKAAEKMVLDKFEDNLDDQVQKFNDQLNSVARIYSSVVGSTAKSTTPSKEFVIKLV